MTAPWSVAVVPPPVLEKTDRPRGRPGLHGARGPRTLAAGQHPGPRRRGDPDRVRGAGQQADRLGHPPPGRRRRQGAGPDRRRRPGARDRVRRQGVAAVLVRAEGHRGVRQPGGRPVRRPGRSRTRPPGSSIEEPTHDRDVPPEATVPLQFAVDDDFGIQLVRLVYKVAVGPLRADPRGDHPALGRPRAPRRGRPGPSARRSAIAGTSRPSRTSSPARSSPSTPRPATSTT